MQTAAPKPAANENETDWIAMPADRFAAALDNLDKLAKRSAAKQRRAGRRSFWI